MIIHQPEITVKDGKAILWTKLETAKSRENFPEYVWFRVPEKFADALSMQCDAFLLASLFAAMHFKENIVVRGSVSPKLAYNLEEYQFIMNLRKPAMVHPISIKYDNLASITAKPELVGAAFSGGIDSLFTIWEHLPQNQRDSNFQITHGVFVQGFDMYHSDSEHFQRLLRKYREQLSRINIEIIPIETNMVSIIDQTLHMLHFHGPLIPAAGLALSNSFKRFFIASSWDYAMTESRLHTTDPYADAFLSTDTLDIVHHGSMQTRVEKVEKIARWDIAQKALCVCFMDKEMEKNFNCGRCEKCMRTLIPLYANGTLGKFKTFEETIKKNSDILWFGRHLPIPNFYVEEIQGYLKQSKPSLVPWLQLSVFIGFLHFWFIKLIPQPIKKWLNRYGMFPNLSDSWGAYEIPEITNIIKELD